MTKPTCKKNSRQKSRQPRIKESTNSTETRKPLARVSTWLVATTSTAVIGAAVAIGAAKISSYQPAPSGPPVSVKEVSTGPGDGGDSYAFPNEVALTAKQLSAIPVGGPHYQERMQEAMGSRDDFPASSSGTIVAYLTIEGNRNYPIRIENMQAIKLCAAGPAGGALFFNPPGGDAGDTMMGIDLDSPTPTVRQLNNSTSSVFDKRLSGEFFSSKTIVLDKAESQVISITAYSRRSCSFWLKLDILDGDNEVSEVVGNSKRASEASDDRVAEKEIPPFKITELEHNYASYHDFYAGGVTSCAGSGGSWKAIKPSQAEHQCAHYWISP